MENRAKDYLVVNANMPFYLFNQTKKLQNCVTLHWTADYRAVDETINGSIDRWIACGLNKNSY